MASRNGRTSNVLPLASQSAGNIDGRDGRQRPNDPNASGKALSTTYAKGSRRRLFVSPNWQSAMIDAELERHAERASFAYGSVPRWVLPDAQLTLNIPSTEGTQASCHTSLSNRRAPKPLGARLVRIRPRGRRTSGTFPARGLGSSVDQIRCRSMSHLTVFSREGLGVSAPPNLWWVSFACPCPHATDPYATACSQREDAVRIMTDTEIPC